VEVHVQVQPAAKALDDREGARAPIADTMAVGLASVELTQCPRVHRQHGSGETMVPCKQIPQPVGQREDPLAHRNGRQDVIDQVHGALHHPSATAARAEAAAFVGEGYQAL